MCLSKSLSHLLNCYLLLLFWELFLHNLNKSFIQYMFSKHFLWFAFIPLTVIFKYQNFWILMPTNLSISSFTGHAFSIVPQKSWPNPIPQRFSTTSFISTSNIPVRQFWYIVQDMAQSSFFAYGYSIIPAPCVIIFLHWIAFVP